jgi:hypothetical protein
MKIIYSCPSPMPPIIPKPSVAAATSICAPPISETAKLPSISIKPTTHIAPTKAVTIAPFRRPRTKCHSPFALAKNSTANQQRSSFFEAERHRFFQLPSRVSLQATAASRSPRLRSLPRSSTVGFPLHPGLFFHRLILSSAKQTGTYFYNPLIIKVYFCAFNTYLF